MENLFIIPVDKSRLFLKDSVDRIRQRRMRVMTGEKASGNVQDAVFGEVRRNWGWLLGLGIIFVILGIIGLGMTFAVTMASVMMFGVLLLVGAGAQFVDAAKCKGWKGIISHILIAFLYFVAGIGAIFDPLGASSMLTLMLAGALFYRVSERPHGVSNEICRELVLAPSRRSNFHYPWSRHSCALACIRALDNRSIRLGGIDS
jgi:hypothetical protein